MCCKWDESWGAPSECTVNEKRVEVDHQNLLSMRRELRWTIRMCCQWEESPPSTLDSFTAHCDSLPETPFSLTAHSDGRPSDLCLSMTEESRWTTWTLFSLTATSDGPCQLTSDWQQTSEVGHLRMCLSMTATSDGLLQLSSHWQQLLMVRLNSLLIDSIFWWSTVKSLLIDSTVWWWTHQNLLSMTAHSDGPPEVSSHLQHILMVSTSPLFSLTAHSDGPPQLSSHLQHTLMVYLNSLLIDSTFWSGPLQTLLLIDSRQSDGPPSESLLIDSKTVWGGPPQLCCQSLTADFWWSTIRLCFSLSSRLLMVHLNSASHWEAHSDGPPSEVCFNDWQHILRCSTSDSASHWQQFWWSTIRLSALIEKHILRWSTSDSASHL